MARGAITVKIDGQYDDKDINRAIRDLQRLKSDAGGAVGPLGSLKSAALGAAAGFVAMSTVSKVADYLRDAATAAMEDEQSVIALNKAMANVGAGGASKGVQDYISELQRLYGVSDTDLRTAFQKLITATGDVTKSQELLSVAMDISAGTGRDLASVSQALARASTGQWSALTRLGVPLDANIVKSKDFGAAIDVLSQKFGGQAAAAADTYAGRLARLQESAAELQESVGYGLLDALDGLAGALGGTNGAQSAMDELGRQARIAGQNFGVLFDSTSSLYRSLSENIPILQGFGSALKWASDNGFLLQGTLGILGQTIDQVTAALDPNSEAWARVISAQTGGTASIRLANGQMVTYVAGIKQVTAGLDAVPGAAGGAADGLDETSAAADAANWKMDALKAAVDKFTGAISRSQAMDDFKKYLADLDVTLKGNERSFKGMGDAAKENRDTLREAFTQAANNARTWADENGKSAAQWKRHYDGLAKDIVDQFVKDGFKRSDVKKFLMDQGIWYGIGKDVGGNIPKGLAAGVNLNSDVVTSAVQALALAAKSKAEAALGIQSPSKVFAEIGRQTVDGLVLGIEEGKKKAAAKAAELAQATIDAAQATLDGWDTTLDDLRGKLQEAWGVVSDYANPIQQTLAGAFDLGKAYEAAIGADGKLSVEKWMAGAQAGADQAQWYGNILNQIKSDGGSQALIDYLVSAGVEQGGAMGQAIIDNGLIPELNAKFANVQFTTAALAASLVPDWMKAGVDYAQANYEGFKANYGQGGPARIALENLMDRLAKSLERTAKITVVVDEVSGAKVKVDGARANGGPVWPGGAFIVGERGPELFMPQVSGTILPSASMPSSSGSAPAGGNTYAITVQAGVGDPRQIGQQVVELIRRFESSNGRVFAPAA